MSIKIKYTSCTEEGLRASVEVETSELDRAYSAVEDFISYAKMIKDIIANDLDLDDFEECRFSILEYYDFNRRNEEIYFTFEQECSMPNVLPENVKRLAREIANDIVTSISLAKIFRENIQKLKRIQVLISRESAKDELRFDFYGASKAASFALESRLFLLISRKIVNSVSLKINNVDEELDNLLRKHLGAVRDTSVLALDYMRSISDFSYFFDILRTELDGPIKFFISNTNYNYELGVNSYNLAAQNHKKILRVSHTKLKEILPVVVALDAFLLTFTAQDILGSNFSIAEGKDDKPNSTIYGAIELMRCEPNKYLEYLKIGIESFILKREKTPILRSILSYRETSDPAILPLVGAELVIRNLGFKSRLDELNLKISKKSPKSLSLVVLDLPEPICGEFADYLSMTITIKEYSYLISGIADLKELKCKIQT
jgi:hypothetical protein